MDKFINCMHVYGHMSVNFRDICVRQKVFLSSKNHEFKYRKLYALNHKKFIINKFINNLMNEFPTSIHVYGRASVMTYVRDLYYD